MTETEREQTTLLLRLIARQTANMAETIETAVDMLETVIDELALIQADAAET